MKKYFLFAVLILIATPAFAAQRGGNKLALTPVVTYGNEVIGSGSRAVAAAGTAVQLSATSTKISFVDICASADNTGVIAVGGSSVTAAKSGRSGIVLNPDDCYRCPADDLDDVYIDATVSGNSVNYTYYDYV